MTDNKLSFKEYLDNHTPPGLESFIEDSKDVIVATSNFLEVESEEGIDKPRITPRLELILSNFYFVSFDPDQMYSNSLRVVMLFQDTYPQPGVACGIATASYGPPQATLKNMHKRLRETYPPFQGLYPQSGDLRGWCVQGVLMLNSALTTLEGQIGSHIDIWELFTTKFIKWLSDTFPYLVFAMFGKVAQRYSNHIDKGKHTILCTSHPSGRGANYGFNTCNIFNEINYDLALNKRGTIKWEDHAYITK